MANLQDRYQRLGEEYNDLAEEYYDCGDTQERCRCAQRMQNIIEDQRKLQESEEWRGNTYAP